MFNDFIQKVQRRPIDFMFIGTILFFVVSLINISFAWFGMICMVTPFFMAFKTNKNQWCGKYCPRASFFVKIMSRVSLKRPIPNVLKSPKAKRYVITFFCLNLIMVSLSTIMVANGRVLPLDQVRFLMFFTVPFQLPQLLDFTAPAVFVHLGYRIFSIMFSSTLIGLILSVVYMPRTWCSICPVQTLITDLVKNNQKNGESYT